MIAKIILTGLLVFGVIFILYKAFCNAKGNMAKKNVPKKKHFFTTLIENIERNPKKAEDMTSDEIYNLFPHSSDQEIIYNKKKLKHEDKENE